MDKLNIAEKIEYGYIGMGNPNCPDKQASDIDDWFPTFTQAKEAAEFDQPAYRPYLIVEKVEHYEIAGEIK